MSTNKALKQAVVNKDDEFNTMREDIESILNQYGHIIRGKKIYLPADSPNSKIFQVLQERKKNSIYLSSNTTIAVPIDFALYRHDEWEILSTYKPVHEGRELFRRVLIRRKERPV